MPLNSHPNDLRYSNSGRADVTLPPISEIFDVACRGRDPLSLGSRFSDNRRSPTSRTHDVFQPRSSTVGSGPALTGDTYRHPLTSTDQSGFNARSASNRQSNEMLPSYSAHQEPRRRNTLDYYDSRYHGHTSIPSTESLSIGHASDHERGSTNSPAFGILGTSYHTSGAGRSFPRDTITYSHSSSLNTGSTTTTSNLPTSAISQTRVYPNDSRSTSTPGSRSIPRLPTTSTHYSPRSPGAELEEFDANFNMNSGPSSSATYQCTYCGKVFLRPSALKTHMITHTGEKEYACTEEGCGRRFGVRSNMLRHVRLIHQGSSRSTQRNAEEAFTDSESGGENKR